MDTESNSEITYQDIETFIEGHDPMERIVNLDYKYSDDFITVFYRDKEDRKCRRKEPFYPFCWATRKACFRLCEGNRDEVKRLLREFKIGIKRLSNTSSDGIVREEFNDGYLFMFYAKNPMAYRDFTRFFKVAKNPFPKRKKFGEVETEEEKELSRQYLTVTPQEQYLISTGRRFFKGYTDYNNILRMIFDLETSGLNTKKDVINQIGIRFNRPFYNHPNGFEKIFTIQGDTPDERNRNELRAIENFLKIIYTFMPDVVTGHNVENFDWNMIIDACTRLGYPLSDMSAKYFGGEPIRKEDYESILKLGGETETFNATIVPNTITTDSLHAVRRAQALDSNMQRADLKYATRYAKMVKPNRVYVPGDKIGKIWGDKENRYAFNDTDGHWYVMSDDKPLREGYVETTGKYIVERYLLDDIWEGDKVEWKYNSTNFLISKILPVPFKKCTTMGTAGQWKAIMLAWSYEHGLAIPPLKDTGSFTGGLSRLLRTGYVANVIKLDYNSLYPSIILTWGISDTNDLMYAMLKMLEYVLTQREHHKGVKKSAGKVVDSIEPKVMNGTASPEEIEQYRKSSAEYALSDGKQLQMKQLGNSFFGSYGSRNGSMFPWKSVKCAENTTCIGRMCLRLMISHFRNLGYLPIVGDSVSGDTPLLIKYDNGTIELRKICDIFDNHESEIDELGREYDCSEKEFKVLCRSGWTDVKYVYRHRTSKKIYRVYDCNMYVDVTEDHSLYDNLQRKIKPSDVNSLTNFEYYTEPINSEEMYNNPDSEVIMLAEATAVGRVVTVPYRILNGTLSNKILFCKTFGKRFNRKNTYHKCVLAGIRLLYQELHNSGVELEDDEYATWKYEEIHTEVIDNGDDYVYDISLDGTFVNALGMNVVSNTDGFNFQLPDPSTYRYTKEHPYIGQGSNREVKLGKEYVGYEADVAEFNDLYMNKVYSPRGVQKMGLGIDEIVSSTINFSRKNYADYFPEKPEPEDVKLVGNSIKSKKMPEYIAKFLYVGIRLLLNGKGKEFIDEYQKYVRKIYDMKIPLKDIATKGKIKKSTEQYLKDVNEVTKAGRPKSRQAWYELAIKDGLKVDNGDTLYYINTGVKKSDSDVKKITRIFTYVDGEKKNITKDIEKTWKEYRKEHPSTTVTKQQYIASAYKDSFKEEEVLLNCSIVPREIVESEEDHFCTEEMTYNVAKYLDMFNKRINPLLVCFSKDIRYRIRVDNPDDMQFFTEEECKLVSGEPNKPGDQDTYEQLMTIEDKEIQFWTKYDMVPPFIEECGMGKWEDIVADYKERMRIEREKGIDKQKELLAIKIKDISYDEINDYFEDGKIPKEILSIGTVDEDTYDIISNTIDGAIIGNMSILTDELENRNSEFNEDVG